MLSMILKNISVLSWPVFSVNNQTEYTKEHLANQCYELYNTVISLITSQQNNECIDNLNLAAKYINTAAGYILDDATLTAKQALDEAVYTLHYAELTSCNRYPQISHSKFEARKIKNSL